MKSSTRKPALKKAAVAAALLSMVLFATVALAAPGNGNGPPGGFPGQGNGPPQDRGANGNGAGPPSWAGGPGGPSSVHTVPEPSTLLLAIAALGLLVRVGRR